MRSPMPIFNNLVFLIIQGILSINLWDNLFPSQYSPFVAMHFSHLRLHCFQHTLKSTEIRLFSNVKLRHVLSSPHRFCATHAHFAFWKQKIICSGFGLGSREDELAWWWSYRPETGIQSLLNPSPLTKFGRTCFIKRLRTFM